MATIAQVAKAMRRVLTTVADEAGRRSGFIQRQRKLSGAAFVQALVFAWWANPAATAEDRAQAAAARGVAISAYGLDKRCTEQAADCLHQVLAAAVEQVVAADPVAIPLLRRFAAVEVYDGSVLALPDALRAEWPGCGGSAPSGAALKIGVRLDLVSGRLHGPVLGAGRDHDQTLPLAATALPPAGCAWPISASSISASSVLSPSAGASGSVGCRSAPPWPTRPGRGRTYSRCCAPRRPAASTGRSSLVRRRACPRGCWRCACHKRSPTSGGASCARRRPSMAAR